ncbi:MAG: hypothetical protein QXS50_07045 [Candidatus Caldarchaeum sp.]
MDDVVLDFMNGVLASFEREFDIRLPYGGDPWNIPDLVKHPVLVAAGYEDWWAWLRDREWLWATFSSVPGAIGGIKKLRQSGHYVECVTSKPEWAEHNVWKWLGKWRPPFNRVTITSPGVPKLSATDAKLIIDDRLETCLDFVNAGRWAIFFNRAVQPRRLPKVPSPEKLLQARSWAGVLRAVDRAVQKDGAP